MNLTPEKQAQRLIDNFKDKEKGQKNLFDGSHIRVAHEHAKEMIQFCEVFGIDNETIEYWKQVRSIIEKQLEER